MAPYFISIALFLSSVLVAFNDEPKCYKELKTTFFREDYVGQALSLHQVPQSHWEVIFSELYDRSQTVPDVIKARTRYQIVSPLEYPFQPDAAWKLLEEVLFDIFNQTMHDSLVTNVSDIQEMFDYIKRQQRARIEECTKRR